MRKRQHRFLAFILAFIMIFSLLPTAAFASGGWWGTVEGSGNRKPNKSDGLGWTSTGQSGLRVTVVWFPIQKLNDVTDSYLDGSRPVDAANGMVVGTPIDLLIPDKSDNYGNFISKRTKWYGSNIFTDMIKPMASKKEFTDIKGSEYNYDEFAFPINHKDLNLIDIPKVVGYSEAGGTNQQLLDYLLNGAEPTQEFNTILQKYINVAINSGIGSEIGSGIDSGINSGIGADFSVDMFPTGKYNGEIGQYYVFLENVYYVTNSEGNWALTLREILRKFDPGDSFAKGQLWWDQQTPITGMANGMHLASKKSDLQTVITKDLGLSNFSGSRNYVSQCDPYSDGLAVFNISPDAQPGQAIATHVNVFMNGKDNVESQGIEYLKQDGSAKSLTSITDAMVQAAFINLSGMETDTDYIACPIHKGAVTKANGMEVNIQGRDIWVCTEHQVVGTCIGEGNSLDTGHYVRASEVNADGKCKEHDIGYGKHGNIELITEGAGIGDNNLMRGFSSVVTANSLANTVNEQAATTCNIISEAQKNTSGSLAVNTELLGEALVSVLQNPSVRDELVKNISIWQSTISAPHPTSIGYNQVATINVGLMSKTYEALKAWSAETGKSLEQFGIIDIDESVFKDTNRVDGLYLNNGESWNGTMEDVFNYDQVGILRSDIPYLVSKDNTTFKIPIISSALSLRINNSENPDTPAKMQKAVIKDFVTDLLNKLGEVMYDTYESTGAGNGKITTTYIRKITEEVDKIIWEYLGWGDMSAGVSTGIESITKALKVEPELSILDHVMYGTPGSSDIKGAFSIMEVSNISPTIIFEVMTSDELGKYINTNSEEEALALVNTLMQPYDFKFTQVSDYIAFRDAFKSLQHHLIALVTYENDMIYGEYSNGANGYKVNQIDANGINQVISDAMKIINYASTNVNIAAQQTGSGDFIEMPLGTAFNYRTSADGETYKSFLHKDKNFLENYDEIREKVITNTAISTALTAPNVGSFEYIENATESDIKEMIKNVTISQLNQSLQSGVYAEDGDGYTNYYKIQGDYGVSYTFWAEAIPVDLHVIGIGPTPETSINTIIHNWGSASPNFRNKIDVADSIKMELGGKMSEISIQYAAIKPASQDFTSFFTEMVESTDKTVNSGKSNQSKVIKPGEDKGTMIETTDPYKLSASDNKKEVLLENTYFFSVTDEDVENTIPSNQTTGKDSKGRVEVVLVIKSDEPIVQYNIIDQLDGKETLVEKTFPMEDGNGNIILEPAKPGADLVEWETNVEDKEPNIWEDIPSNPIQTGEDSTITITDKPGAIYVHYVPKESKATGTGTLSQKRITGSHKISDLSSDGILPVEWDWQSAGSHPHSSLTGTYYVPRTSPVISEKTGEPMNQAYMWIVNWKEDTLGSTGLVADTTTGKFGPSFDSTRHKAWTNLAWSGGVEHQDTEYYINLFRAKDMPTVASYANNGNPGAALGLQTGKVPANPRFDGDKYTGNIEVQLISDSATVGLIGGKTWVNLRHTDGDSENNNSWGVRAADYDITASVASYKGTQNTGNKSSTPNATQNTFTAKTAAGAAVTAYNATGTSFHQDSAYKFYPYVEMVMENWTAGEANKQVERQTVNVLGGHESAMGINDYVEVGYTTKPSSTSTTGLSLESTQWSSHAQAVKNYGKDVVLPGGAIYTLKTPAGSETDVIVSMWLNMLDTDTIANAATNNPTAYSEATQLAGANAFLDSVKKSLDRYDVVQHLVDGKITNPASILGATGSSHVIVGMAGGTPLLDGQTMTSDAKYFLNRNTQVGSTKANEADLDVLKTDQSKTYYAVWSDINGKVYVGKGASMNAAKSNVISTIDKTQGITELANTEELKELDAKTKLLSNYLDSVDRNQGYDPDFGTTWYNEAWRPAYVCKYDTIYTIGLGSPTARTAAVDTHLEPTRSDRASLFADANSSVFAVNVKSSEHPSKPDGYVGTYKGADINIENVANMYVSKVFYIPNVSVTDLVNY